MLGEMTRDIAGSLSALLAATNRLSRVATVRTASSLSATDYRILSTLRQFGAMRIGELAAYHRVSQPAISKAAGSLERDMLVRRVADPVDSRASLLSITTEGERAFTDRLAAIANALTPLFDDLTDADRRVLERATAVLEAALDREKGSSPRASATGRDSQSRR